MNVRLVAALALTSAALHAVPARAQATPPPGGDATPPPEAAPSPDAAPPADGTPVAPIELRGRAEALAASAKGHFDRGEYADAVKDYREAYRLLPSTGLLYNMAQAYRLAGDCAKAAQMYRDYLRLVPESPVRATAEQNLAAAETCSPEPESKPPTPAPAPLPAPPVPAPTPTPVVHEHGDGGGLHGRRLIGVLVAGGGVLVAGAGVYFAVDASSAQHDVADFYAHGGSWSDIQSVDARGKRDRVIAIGAFVTATAALAAGAALWLTATDDEHPVAVIPLPGGAEVTAGWRF